MTRREQNPRQAGDQETENQAKLGVENKFEC